MPTIVTPATIAKIKPPKAPQGGYDWGNEDFFRRLVAKLLRDFATDINTNGGTGGGGGGGGTFAGPFPTSPVFGEVTAAGDSTHPAYAQLKNPAASGKNLFVYELYVSGPINSGSGVLRGKRTGSPVTMTGATVANLIHLEEDNVDTIVGVLSAGPLGSAIAESAADFVGATTSEGSAGWKPAVIRGPAGYPIEVDQGSAIEFSTTVNGAGDSIRMWAVWDEVTP
jgi:hypothetical protein